MCRLAGLKHYYTNAPSCSAQLATRPRFRVHLEATSMTGRNLGRSETWPLLYIAAFRPNLIGATSTPIRLPSSEEIETWWTGACLAGCLCNSRKVGGRFGWVGSAGPQPLLPLVAKFKFISPQWEFILLAMKHGDEPCCRVTRTQHNQRRPPVCLLYSSINSSVFDNSVEALHAKSARLW